MNSSAGTKLGLETTHAGKSAETRQIPSARPTILIAAADPEIRSGLTELLQGFLVDTIWVNGVAEAKRQLISQKISVCLCGFWLQDGTYRELIRHLRHETTKVSVIIVSPPACPNEYRDYLAAINIGALDFLCHPYQPFDFERMLKSAISSQVRSIDENRAVELDTRAEQQKAVHDMPQRGAA